MGRFPKIAHRLSVAGAVALVVGSMMIIGAAVEGLSAPAYADTAPFEMVCAGTPIGNLVFNDVVISGTLSPASPAPGQQFSLVDGQVSAPIPANVLQEALAAGNGSLSGTISSTVEATGATPASMSTGALSFSETIPNPPPAAGMTLPIPSSPVTLGPFTATSSTISLALGSKTSFDVQDGDFGPLDLSCSAYPNDAIPQSGLTNAIPPGLPVSPVIAVAGGASTTPPTASVTGPYELYCPHTPVGDLVFNDVTTSATVSGGLAAGDTFSVAGYQTAIPLPPGVVQAAAGLGNTGFAGEAASAVDAYGASPDQASTGSLNFDLPIPSGSTSTGLTLDIPTTPTTVGSFTADGGPITIAQDQSTYVVAALSSKAFTMSCTAYPNDTEATSGSTGTAPDASPIRPIIAVASASGTPASTTTTAPLTGVTGPETVPAGSPYELYCPGTPVGTIVLNDTTTSGTLSPSTLTQGEEFSLSGLSTTFSIPQSVAQQAETLGLTQLTGNMSVFLDTTGVYGDGGGVVPVSVATGGSGSSGSTPTTTIPVQGATTTTTTTAVESNPGGPAVIVPYPGPYGLLDMSFDVTLPNPVPASGVQFTATPPAGLSEYFTAEGGPIQIAVSSVNMNVNEFGDEFGFFCSTYPNDTEPTGLSTAFPEASPVEPIVATGTAALAPPTQGNEGPYELFCPNTPIGDIVMNNVTTTGTLSPANPATGSQFDVTGYQTTITIPPSIASQAAAVGNTAISGTATTALDVTGATPSSISTGTLSYDIPIPTPIPTTGLQYTFPTSPTTVGPFTASGGGIVVTQDPKVALTFEDAGTALSFNCETYPNNTEPTGLVGQPPFTAPAAPVLALGDGATLPPPPTTGANAYELYCPGTPVGNIALNDVTTSGTISPADPTSGEQFNLTGYQSEIELPDQIVEAAAALGNTAITGSAETSVDATGATPAEVSTGEMTLDAPIPSPVPANGLELSIPSSPLTLGPFTATGGTITIVQDEDVSLTLVVSGSSLNLTCHTYPNDSAPTGIVTSAPTSAIAAPVIATTGTSTTGTTGTSTPVTVTEPPPTSPPDTDTVAPTTPSSVAPTTPSSVAPTTPSSVAPTAGSGTSPSGTSPSGTGTVPPTSPGTVAPTTSATQPTGSGSQGSGTTAPSTASGGGSSSGGSSSGNSPSGDSSNSGGSGAGTGSPVVSASSGSLAFTGPGSVLRWVLVLGATLVVVGLALLVVVDTPRRLLHRLAASRASRSAPGQGPDDLWYRGA